MKRIIGDGLARAGQLVKAPRNAGEAGPQGERGPQGAQGPAGAPGPQGPEGPAGSPGGPSPAGPAGEPGAAGPQGDTGAQGEPGHHGEAGSQGTPGPQGESGPQGEPGPQGDPGPAGTSGEGGPASVVVAAGRFRADGSPVWNWSCQARPLPSTDDRVHFFAVDSPANGSQAVIVTGTAVTDGDQFPLTFEVATDGSPEVKEAIGSGHVVVRLSAPHKDTKLGEFQLLVSDFASRVG